MLLNGAFFGTRNELFGYNMPFLTQYTMSTRGFRTLILGVLHSITRLKHANKKQNIQNQFIVSFDLCRCDWDLAILLTKCPLDDVSLHLSTLKPATPWISVETVAFNHQVRMTS